MVLYSESVSMEVGRILMRIFFDTCIRNLVFEWLLVPKYTNKFAIHVITAI